MENPIIEAKKELIEWISHLDDLEILQELLDLKNKDESIPLVSEPHTEYAVKDDFDERFAKGLTSKELLTDVFAHIDSLPWREK